MDQRGAPTTMILLDQEKRIPNKRGRRVYHLKETPDDERAVKGNESNDKKRYKEF